MNQKIDKYFNLIHPDFEQLSSEESYYAAGDRVFIGEHIDEIDRAFQNIVGATERRGKEVNKSKIMKIVFDGVRADKYAELLHPDFEQLSSKESYYAAGDGVFIGEHIDEIDRAFQDIVGATERRGKEVNKSEIMKIVFDGVRADKYAELLHPDRDQLSPTERYHAAGDRVFIGEHIDEIDRAFQDIVGATERRGEEVNKQEVIKKVMSGIKNKQFSIQQIGKATINTPTTAKMEAERVEQENTKENVKEGEEVRYDN